MAGTSYCHFWRMADLSQAALLEELYGVGVSLDSIGRVTDVALEEVPECGSSRPKRPSSGSR